MTNFNDSYRQAVGEAPAMLHLRHNGNSHDVSLSRLSVSSSSSDHDIKAAVSATLDLDYAAIQKLVVERLQNGNITLRPEAVFGI